MTAQPTSTEPQRCIHGHELTAANTAYKTDRLGRKVRICLTCQSAQRGQRQ